ncbi:uncharacterized protein BDW70DRAFT_161961 [Aspergillus foveolatus]|uniref:uncharacterized protein n=1 Tax=Aspergillus foveolatus TaxID=210207 RepID=UPI003CCDD755
MPLPVANVNGSDWSVDLDWENVITQGAACGKAVLGYVRTGYLELPYDAYKNSYTPNWTPKDRRKLWYIIYSVPESAMAEVAQLAMELCSSNTRYLMPSPYHTLPGESYIQTMMDAVDGGSLLNKGAPSLPSRAAPALSLDSVMHSDYSSAKLS